MKSVGKINIHSRDRL